MAAILDFTRKRGFSEGGFGWGFMGIFTWPTESNSVEKPLLNQHWFSGLCLLGKITQP